MSGFERDKTLRILRLHADRVAGMSQPYDKTAQALRQAIVSEIRNHPANASLIKPDDVSQEDWDRRLEILPWFHARLLVLDEVIYRLEQNRKAHREVIERDRMNGIAYKWVPYNLDQLVVGTNDE